MLNENGKLLLGFAEDNKFAILNTLFCTPKRDSKGQARLSYVLTEQAHGRLICCVNVRRSPLDAPESDHNLVYAKLCIPRGSAQNRNKRDSTNQIQKTADLRRLLAHPSL